ncbi:amino acid adenylation domain-containing protein [Actinomadura sp. GTD37]|uniref:non-ribosomal peptide synthetase n=1 Tax=Actinomadura sp. GTD37 TaxID=1778030 RepID=UPI0035C010CA
MAERLRGTPPGDVLGGPVPYPDDMTILGLFEARAAERPDAPALVFGDRVLTYGVLDRRANALAARLADAGIGRGDFSCLAVDGGLELPLGMIAAMKVAAPFVPIDHTGPGERTERMLDALDAKLVLRSPGGVPLPGGRPEMTVDATAAEEREAPPSSPPAGLEDLAYGFYTSGSTGIPKCALNVHRGLLNRFLYMSRRFDDGSGKVVLQNSHHLFDSSLWQLLWPLTAGNVVVIPDRSGVLDLTATIEVIHRHGVTMTDFVPSIFNTLVEMLRARPDLVPRLASLRRLLIGGEEMTPGTVHAFRALLPRVAVVNTFGPTEASIGSVFHEVTAADGDDIPIGLPIDNTYAVIVDEEMRPVEPGGTGEICIGGDCVGLGYVDDPAKTAAAFVRNPFPQIPGDRLYRTGDRGHRRADGLLMFAGRLDHQVKIAGVRIELPEVEAALLRHPDVRDAKAIVHQASGARLLVAFVVRRSGETGAGDLGEHARAALPAAMVPRRIIVLPDLPLTPNGKADRRQLARIAAAQAGAADGDPPVAGAAASAAPAADDDVPAAVAAIWRDLLPFGAAGAAGDFFDLGGDSLIAHRLTAAFADRFGVDVPVRDVFAYPAFDQHVALVQGDGPAEHDAADPGLVMADTVLPADITASGAAPPAAPPAAMDDVLLTGATGFVGAQLLRDLLTRTSATVHCLVRGDDGRSARDRIIANLRYYRLWDDAFAGRVRVLAGDLRRPRFGLGDAGFARLAARVDTILHNAAMINLARDYRAHRDANVSGTVEVLRLATTTRLKHVHFMSTIGVLPAGVDDEGAAALETPVDPAGPRPGDGYGLSKWVGERLLEQAADRGVPTTVYRLGEVLPHSGTGVPSRRGLSDLIIKACLHTGSWFRSPVAMDCTPVDYVGAFVVEAAAGGGGGCFHVVQPAAQCLDDLLAAFTARFGLAEVAYPEFWEAVSRAAENRPDDRDLAGVLALLPRPDGDGDRISASLTALFWGEATAVSRTRAERLITEAGLPWTPIAPALFDRYATYYHSVDEAVG